MYSKVPTDLSSASSNLDIDDIYGNAVIDYVLFRAYQKDSEYAGNAQRAQTHYQLFLNCIGQGMQAQELLSPNNDRTSNIGGMPMPPVVPQQGR